MAVDRRVFLTALALAGATGARSTAAAAKPIVVVHKDPSCGCCGAWVEHIAAAGFPTRVVEDVRVNAVKARLGVPVAMRSCHTAEVDGYVIEGHVPVAALERLLAERPAVRGLAVPGMPIGSPGMEVPGEPAETYDVMAFGTDSAAVFMRFRGSDRIDG
ncbi:DUF411 domain-containing protein [Phreatobacter stygius]|uniref:DUF411 domain-containing protein n=1 Tax=Phreatobacter stygius TaxID=1940610 RepID=A0A4D7B032_9HYPH|nr:DUF411 domain-containing protein [Phreatobacter stygius]QCI66031.1 DUF411 domain-containing protein [Phreatobacter stygius]